MKCPKCGKVIADESKFCEFCGTQVASPQNVAQETSVHVRWLLFVTTLFICLFNVFAFYEIFLHSAYGKYPHFDTGVLWIVPAISLILFIIGLILSIKKKLKGIYTIMLFLIFGINTAIPITAETCKDWGSKHYIVSLELRENGTYVGGMSGYYFNNYDQAQEVEQVLTNMINSGHRKYREKIELDTWHYYSASHIEDITYVYWFAEGLIMLIYLIIASVASIKEKKKNA